MKVHIKMFLDHKVGVSHDRRTWLGRLSKNESLMWFGVDFGRSFLRISEDTGLIQVLKKSKHGYIKNGAERFSCGAYFNSNTPHASRFETNGKARSAIIQLMTS